MKSNVSDVGNTNQIILYYPRIGYTEVFSLLKEKVTDHNEETGMRSTIPVWDTGTGGLAAALTATLNKPAPASQRPWLKEVPDHRPLFI